MKRTVFLCAAMLVSLLVLSCGGGGSDGGGLNPPTYNLTGTWDVTETAWHACGAAPAGGGGEHFTITIDHPDGSNSMTATESISNETLNLTVSGNKVTASLSGSSASCPQGLTQSWDITASSASYMSGTNNWTCKADYYDGGSCTATDDIVAIKQGNGGGATPPTITGFNPTSGAVGTAVTITGTNFSTPTVNNTVMFNGTTATVTSSTATSITTSVPAGATTGPITVTVGGGTATSATNFTVASATNQTLAITSFSPVSGAVGAAVTITGTGFSTTAANNTVEFNGTTATVTNSTATSITTSVPAGATPGPLTVTVGGGTATSATNFTVIATPPGGGILEQEPNDDPQDAQSIELNDIIQGTGSGNYSDSSSDIDRYVINLSTPGNYTIQLSFDNTADLDLYLLDSGGIPINMSETVAFGGTETITHMVNSGGTYYIAVNCWESTATTSYTLTVQMQ